MWEDLAFFVPCTLLLIVVMLFLSFRSLRGVLLPVVTVVVSLIWTLGIMVLTGSSLSLGNMALPPLVLVLGTAYSLHIVAEYYEQVRPERSVAMLSWQRCATTNTPLFIAAFTTVLGFLSLIVNRIVSIRELGLYASIGISTAFILSVVFVPALLILLPLPTRRDGGLFFAGRRGAATLARLSSRHRRAVITAGVLIVSGLSSVRLRDPGWL